MPTVRGARPRSVLFLSGVLALVALASAGVGLFLVGSLPWAVRRSNKFESRGWDEIEWLIVGVGAGLVLGGVLIGLLARGFLAGRRWAFLLVGLALLGGILWAGVPLVMSLVVSGGELVPYTAPPLVGCGVLGVLLMRRSTRAWFGLP